MSHHYVISSYKSMNYSITHGHLLMEKIERKIINERNYSVINNSQKIGINCFTLMSLNPKKSKKIFTYLNIWF